VRYYGQWMRDEAEKRIGHLYPKVEVTAEMAKERPDLQPYIGKKLTVIAWLWARTVKSPNPAFADIDVPLISTYILSTKTSKDAYLEPKIADRTYRFAVRLGKPTNPEKAKAGTKMTGANFTCIMSGAAIPADYIRSEASQGRMGARLLAIVIEGQRGRHYLPAIPEHEAIALGAVPDWKPDIEFFTEALGFRVGNYGMTKWSELFTRRQLVALKTFSDLLGAARDKIHRTAIASGMKDRDGSRLCTNGNGAAAYADAVAVYLALGISRLADAQNALCQWGPSADQTQHLFRRQAIPIVWDFAESSVLSGAAGDLTTSLSSIRRVLENLGGGSVGTALQQDAQSQSISSGKVISTDPPYYDNVGYADLSDFFYVWLRNPLKPIFPDLFSTVSTPKSEELVATPGRHGGRDEAEAFFLEGMTKAMRCLADAAHPSFPVTIYYAFKQSESETDAGTTSTGWETFLDAVNRAGFATTGTWPIRTEREARSRSIGSNALATSIILVCQHRPPHAPVATRRDLIAALKAELPAALAHLQAGNIAPVDLAQAAIGPGMAVYTRFAKVLDADGKPVSVREALSLINQTLDEALADQEGDFDSGTRWALAWFEQNGFAEGEYGVAETLSKAKNTSIGGMVEAGILESKRGKVRLFKPGDLSHDWYPATDRRLNAWEIVHHLIRVLEADGEAEAARLVAMLGTNAEIARELAYRLYVIAERKKRAAEALSYNGLVQSWPEIQRLAGEVCETMPPAQPRLI